MKRKHVLLVSGVNPFAFLRVGRRPDGVAILRVSYFESRFVDIELSTGWQGITIGTSVFDVRLCKDGIVIRKVSGSIKLNA